MAETIATIAARERLAYPFPQTYTVSTINPNGTVTETVVTMTQQEYDQWILDRAAAQRNQQLAAEAEVARHAALQAQIDRLQPILNKLNAVPIQNLTGAETRQVLQDTLVYLLPKMIAEAQSQLNGMPSA